MSITKRFSIYMTIELIISILLYVGIMAWVIAESPAAVQTENVFKSYITSPFIALGYEQGDRKGELIRADPLDHLPSRVHYQLDPYGELERVDCEAAYVNTQPASEIYADMEAVMQALGGSLDSQKEEVVKVINEIKNDQSSRTSGTIGTITWGISSSTYKDGKGGQIRYLCFGATAKYELD